VEPSTVAACSHHGFEEGWPYNYVPSSNLLFCGYEVIIYGVIYDETYGVIIW
jgi:hypothetical protein